MIGSVFAGQLLGNTENLHQPAVTVEMDDAGIIGIRNIQIAVLIHKHTARVFKWILFRPRIDTIHHALGIRTQNTVITGIHDIQIALRTDKQSCGLYSCRTSPSGVRKVCHAVSTSYTEGTGTRREPSST